MSTACQGIVSTRLTRLARLAALALSGALVSAGADAAVITDANFFLSFPSTLVNFETDGAGQPVILIEGESRAMPVNEYLASGITFANPINWVNDGDSAFDAAQAIGGSLDVSIPSSTVNQFEVQFNVPVFAVGFWVINNRIADPAGPTITARASDGTTIETVQFGSVFIDGTITTPNTTADYGFMGILSSKPIASINVNKQAAIFDDLRHSPVPTPGAIALLAMGGMLVWNRRRA